TGRSAEACDRKNDAHRPGWTRSRWGRGPRAYARIGELALRYKPDGSGDVGRRWGVARGGGAPGLLHPRPPCHARRPHSRFEIRIVPTSEWESSDFPFAT